MLRIANPKFNFSALGGIDIPGLKENNTHRDGGNAKSQKDIIDNPKAPLPLPGGDRPILDSQKEQNISGPGFTASGLPIRAGGLPSSNPSNLVLTTNSDFKKNKNFPTPIQSQNTQTAQEKSSNIGMIIAFIAFIFLIN